MYAELERMCERFIDGEEVVHNCYRWSGMTLRCIGATLMLDYERNLNAETLKNVKNLLKSREGIFSSFRSNREIPLAVSMGYTSDWEEYYNHVKAIDEEVKKTSFFSNSFSPIASMIIADNVSPENQRHYIVRTTMIYDQMKKDHAFLTSGDDIIFAALLAVSDIDSDNILLEMDEAYRILKEQIHNSHIQELSHILALNLNSPGEKVSQFMELYQLMKDRGNKIERSYHLELLGVASLLEMDYTILVEQIEEVTRYLQAYPKFRGLSMFKEERMIYAMALVIRFFSQDNKLVDSVLTYVLLRIQAERDAAAAAAAAA